MPRRPDVFVLTKLTVLETLSALPRHEADALTVYYGSALTQAGTAAALGVSTRTISSRLKAGLKTMARVETARAEREA